MPSLTFDRVCKTYDGTKNVVDDLDLRIADGEFLTLLGPSGSGKTTTLLMLAGFETPTGGQIRSDGEPLDRVPAYKRNFGFVFQNYALFPHLSVLENILFPLRMRKIDAATACKRASQSLDMVQLGHCAARYPRELSGGQQQRVALARALTFEPDVVLMDEPLGALDKNLREELQLEIKHLHERLGVTFVFVTHDQEEALTMSDRIAVFDDGKLQQVGSPRDVYTRPANPFVAKFLGDVNDLKCSAVSPTGNGTVELELHGSLKTRTRMNGTPGQPDDYAVYIRPEQLRLVNAETAGLIGGVKEVIYRGAYVVATVELSDGDVLKVMQLSATLDGSLKAGESVGIDVEENAGIIFNVSHKA